MDGANYTEDGKCGGYFFEFCDRGVLVHGDMGTRSRGTLEVGFQDGGTLAGGDLFEGNFLTTAAAQDGSSTGCTDVADPLRVLSEH